MERGQTSAVYDQDSQKKYQGPFVLDTSQVLEKSFPKSKTAREMANTYLPKSSFEHTGTFRSRELLLSRMSRRNSEFLPYEFSSSSVEPSEILYRYNNNEYEKLKKGNELWHVLMDLTNYYHIFYVI
jgi:hypothetical protein